jgi:ppGpp synthetase/RelA/SpoT-type nucleotidyltranferase
MSIFYDSEKSKTPQPYESLAKGKRTDFRDNFSSAWDAFTKTEMILSEINNLDEAYGDIQEILTKAGHTNFISPTDRSNYMVDDVEIPPSRRSLEAAYWQQIAEVSATDENLKNLLVEAGLDTQENMHKLISEQSQSVWKDFADISERATTMGKVGGFTGVAAGAFTDPVMLSTLPLSMMYSVPTNFSKAAWKVAKAELILAGVAETVIQSQVQPYRAELGFEDAGFATGAKNVAMVAAAAGTLSPALLGVFRAFGKGYEVGKKYIFKLSDEELKIVSKEMGDLNPKFKDAELDKYNIPEKDNPFPDNRAGRAEHNERLDTTVKALQNDEDVNLPAPKSQIVPDNLDPPAKIKPGEFFDIFDNEGNVIKAQTISVSKQTGAIKIKLGDGSERIISVDPKSSAFLSIRNPNYVIRSAGVNAQGKTVSQISKKELPQIKKNLQDRINEMEAAGTTNQGSYRDAVEDLNSIDFNVNKATNQTNSANINKANFNKNESKLAEELENVKDFDVPTEATYRNQASVSEGEIFDAGTSAAIRVEAEAGAAAKTVPSFKPSAKIQSLVSKSQETDAALSSTVLATAQSKPPLIRGLDNKTVGDINSIGKRLYQKSDNYKEIYDTLSAKIDDVKNELQPIATKYNGDLKARIKDKAKIDEKLNTKTDLTPINVPDWLGVRISVDTITQAKLVLSDLNKKYKFIEIDDFLDDVGRTQRKFPTEYRRIHTQALTKDGYSFELQISLKELDPIIDKSHAIYKKITYQRDSMPMAEFNKTLKEQAKAEADMKNAYFKIKDQEFSRLNPTNDIDKPIPIGQRFDEDIGETVSLTKTAREIFEDDAKNLTMLKRLEDCV